MQITMKFWAAMLASLAAIAMGGPVRTVSSGTGQNGILATSFAPLVGPSERVPGTFFGMHAGYPTHSNPYAWPGNFVPFCAYRLWDTEGTGWADIQRVGPQRIKSIRRNKNVVTVMTAKDHGMLSGAIATVVISGVRDAKFNGTFDVTAVTSPSSFAYAQRGRDEPSEGGNVLTSDWTMLDGAVAKAEDREVLYTFGSVPTWATKVEPALVPISSIQHSGNLYTVTTATPHGYRLNPAAPQLVVISSVQDHRFDGTYRLKSVRDELTFTFEDAALNLPEESHGGAAQLYDQGGGINLGTVPNTRVPLAPATAMEPDPALFKSFIQQLVTRYCGCDRNRRPRLHISQYEIWNEPNLTAERGNGATFFVPVRGRSVQSSAAAMVDISRLVYRTVKQADGGAVVASPSATGDQTMTGSAWVEEFLNDGGAQYFDVLAYHFYVGSQPPEAFLSVIATVRRSMHEHHVNKPLWNTEMGWGGNQDFPFPLGPAYVARTYLLGWAASLERVYWYSWDSQCWAKLRMTSSQAEPPACTNGKSVSGITPAAVAYGEVYKWLAGATEDGCGIHGDAWVCSLTRPRNYHAWVVWMSNGAGTFPVPSEWKIARIRDLSGAAHNLTGSNADIGPAPILLETTANWAE